MLRLKLDEACMAKSGHTQFIKKRTIRPVVVSAKRFNAIMSRSRMDNKNEKLAAIEEERRYMQYHMEQNNALCSRFTNMGGQNLEEEQEAKLEQEIKEDAIRKRQNKLEDEQLRKERVLRAHRILEDMKPGQRALHHALVESEMIRQRKYNEALNREISEDALRQQRQEDQLCPEILIPFCYVTEEQEKAEQKAKAQAVRAYILKNIDERRQRRLDEKEREECDCIVERAQYKCLQEKEEKAAKELAKRKREFCRRSLEESLKEKAETAKYELMCDRIDDRVNCVGNVTHRYMDGRFDKEIKKRRAEIIRDREARAVRICQLHQAKKRKDQELQDGIHERYDFEVLADEGRRQCEIEELSKQRRAYELEDRKRAEEQRQRDVHIRRFEIAERLKNQESNSRYYAIRKQRKDKEIADLRDVLHGQRDEFLERRQNELMRMSACVEDPYLQQDVIFFNKAVKLMRQGRKVGRPLFPLAKAVETYRRQNQIDMVPEGRMVRRSKLRDYCWPGYHSKADLAYRKYEHIENCRQQQERDRHEIFNNCIRITKMAAEEQPYKQCTTECPIKCFHHRGMPPIESVASFDCGKNVCYEDDPTAGACPSDVQIIKKCEKDISREDSKFNIELGQNKTSKDPCSIPPVQESSLGFNNTRTDNTTPIPSNLKMSKGLLHLDSKTSLPNRPDTFRSAAGAYQLSDAQAHKTPKKLKTQTKTWL